MEIHTGKSHSAFSLHDVLSGPARNEPTKADSSITSLGIETPSAHTIEPHVKNIIPLVLQT